MPKPILPPEVLIEMLFPGQGVNLATEFELQPPQTTPTGTNVRSYEALTQRARGGSRPGIARYVPQQIPEGAKLIQHLNFIVDPSEDALVTAFDPLDNSVPPLTFGFPFGPGLFTPFTVPLPQGSPLGGTPDPSTNNLTFRNPGRNVRTGGSGSTPNKNVSSVIIPSTRVAFAQALSTIGGGLNMSPDVSADGTTFNWYLGGGGFRAKPPTPKLNWKVVVYQCVLVQDSTIPDLINVTSVEVAASGLAGVALPDLLPTYRREFNNTGVGPEQGDIYFLYCLETQNFPQGLYPTTLDKIDRAKDVEHDFPYNIPAV